VKINNKSINIGELFCGPGGFAEGAKKAGDFKHVWANDLHEETCATFRDHHEECDVIQGDVNEVFIKKKMKGLQKIDGLIFGFPCNDFSIVGKTLGLQGKYGPLYKAACKVLNYFQPKFFVAENVSSIAPLNDKNQNSEQFLNFTKIMKDLASCSKQGYHIYADKFKFEEYGVPQTRHRQILVGYRGDFFKKNNISYEKPQKNSKFVSCKTALEKGVPGTKQNKELLKKAKNQELTRHSERVLKRLENTKEGQNVWQIDDEFGLPNVKSARMSQIYKKLDSNKPAYTVTGSGGGGTHVYHYKENRALTNRERARLQTFDDTYQFIGSKESVRRQIGMAVPVLAAKQIMKSVKQSLKKRKKRDRFHHDMMIEPNGKKLSFTAEIQLDLEL
jgi:DNA (cytosine-5)-methyltransferase 1